MTKDELQENDIIELRNDEMFMVHRLNGELFFVNSKGYLVGKNHNKYLRSVYGGERDVLNVRRPTEGYMLKENSWRTAPTIWERKDKEIPNLNDFENVICGRLTEKNYEYISRNKDDHLVAHRGMPKRFLGAYWDSTLGEISLEIADKDFQFVSWEDNPWSVSELLNPYRPDNF